MSAIGSGIDLIKALVKQGYPHEEAVRIVKSKTTDIPRKRIGDGVEVIEGQPKHGDIIDAEYNPLKITGKLADAPRKSEVKDKAPKSESMKKDPSLWGLAAPVTGAAALGAAVSGQDGSLPSSPPKEEIPPKPTEPKVITPENTIPVTGKKPKEEDKKTTDIDRILLPKSEEETELNKRLKENLDAFSKLKDPEVRSKSRREQMFKDLSDVRDNREKALMWASLAERFLAAATKYAAAKEGRARNLNMSKAEIERTDWDGMIDRAYAKYKEDYENLAGDLAAEDKAVATSRKQREDILKESKDLAQQLARLKDARAREQARLDQKRQELIQRAKERGLDRESRKEIAKIRKSPKDITQFTSEFTDDPATANELKVAAMQGEKQFEKTLNSASVRDKLKPAALMNYMKSTWFGFGDKKLDPEAVQKQVLTEDSISFPLTVFKGGQQAQVSNEREWKEAQAEGWSK